MEKYMSGKYAEIPLEVMADSRLTLETMRVLLVLYSFRDELTGIAIAGREDISGRCGIHISNVSNATARLVELGWIKKEGKGGFSKHTRYTIIIPDAVSEIVEANKARSQKWVEDLKHPYISYSVRTCVFERDAYRCVKCGSYKSLCVDHKHPHSLGGSSEPDNLQTLCWKCNSKKGAKIEVVE